MPRAHVAIITADVLAALQAGTKRIETRFTRTRRAPFDRVLPAERIWFKPRGQRIAGFSQVSFVKQFTDLTPARIADLRRRFNHLVVASPGYWRARKFARYAVLIGLTPFTAQPIDAPLPRQFGNAWLMLDPAKIPPEALAKTQQQIY